MQRFHDGVNPFFPALLLAAFFNRIEGGASLGAKASDARLPLMPNDTIFTFHAIDTCRRNEFYNLDTFACVPCTMERDNEDGGTVNEEEIDLRLQATADKLYCQCAPTFSTVALYDTRRRGPICVDICSDRTEPIHAIGGQCQPASTTALSASGTSNNCQYKYINSTADAQIIGQQVGLSAGAGAGAAAGGVPLSKSIRITTFNPMTGQNCSECNQRYNFRYRDYCIASSLLKAFLRYNAFWQATSMNAHSGDLKFVAFFCLTLRNATSCQQLANLCVLSFYSLDKNSPCSAFLLAQASDAAVIRYASVDERELQAVRPFLFYKKGKHTAKRLTEPNGAAQPYTLLDQSNGNGDSHLQFFSSVYALDGALLRWSEFRLGHVNLCRLHVADESTRRGIRFAQRHAERDCRLTLENLIDLATIYANNNFMSIFLNRTALDGKSTIMETVPILIENLSTENQRNQPEDWQLVKRIQLIEAHRRHRFGERRGAAYEDAHKLLLYRSIRYIERLEITYKIHAHNQISVPLMRLRYRHIELSANSTLEALYTFTLNVSYERIGETSQRALLDQVAYPLLLFAACIAATVRAYNGRKRRMAATATLTPGATYDLFDGACAAEFVLQLISNTANALLACFLLHVASAALRFLTQRTIETTLPLEKPEHSLTALVYVALVMKFMYLCVHFWRISHPDLFFIDWERPKSCESNYFNVKSNLETSSVCSSVRTFVAESNVSVWRTLFIANEWIRLSAKQKTSIMAQGFLVLIVFELLDGAGITHNDRTLQSFLLIVAYLTIYVAQLLCRLLVAHRICGHPLERYIDLCSLANISVFTLIEPAYGYYIHGRSPHGFSDTDMLNLIMQLQRESQSMCPRRGLLSDSDQQTYIIMPPTNLRGYFDKLVIPLQRSSSISQAHFQKEINSIEGNWDRASIAYSSVNRFFCAFIDHAIKDMDYIIKERTFIESLLDCEFDRYLTENKGTFYIDKACSFGQLLLYGNEMQLFTLNLLLLFSTYTLTSNLTASIVVVCLLNKLFQCIFRSWVLQNVAKKTLIDRRFLM